jgi:hypothetical protein
MAHAYCRSWNYWTGLTGDSDEGSRLTWRCSGRSPFLASLGRALAAERQGRWAIAMLRAEPQSLSRFSREAFEGSADPTRLCAELQAVLLPRLEAAADRLAEAHLIVEDLRRAGHTLFSWDESNDFSTWGDDYMNPPLPTRFLVELRWPSEDEPSQPVDVAISFGLRPKHGGQTP